MLSVLRLRTPTVRYYPQLSDCDIALSLCFARDEAPTF